MVLHKQDLKNLKPGVNRTVHLFAAPLLWTSVGILMMARGWGWIGPEKKWLLAAALIIGTIKSLLVLDRTASVGIARIVNLRDGTCLGAVYSWKTWLVVGLMIGSGYLLRTFFQPGMIIGTIYLAIGWALLFSSRLGWLEWSRWLMRKK